MRVLQAIAEMAVGGAERVVVELAGGLIEDGDRVAVAADRGPLDAELASLQHERHPIAGHGRSPRRLTLGAIQLARAVRRFEPDVIHSHNVKATAMAAAARLLAGRARTPLLATYHGVTPAEERMAARVLHVADEVVCVSVAAGERLAAAGFRGHVAVIRNAVPIPGPLPPRRRLALDLELGLRDACVVSTVGRLVSQKAHHRFVQAMALIADEYPSTRFLVVGEGPLRAETERRVRSLGLDGRVVMTGARTDARELIARSAVIVFCSDWEGLSLTALEALAAGVPVVATDVSGMRELLAEGAGLIVAPDPAEIAAGVAALLGDPERRAAMGSMGAEIVGRRFSLDAMLRDYRRLYERSVAGAR